MKLSIFVTALASFILITARAEAQYAPDTCASGYVWREAFPGDRVCVTPRARDQSAQDNSQAQARRQPGGGPYGPDTCRPGYVWREARPGDRVCVTPETRQQVIADNNQAASRRLNSTGAQENTGQTQQGLVRGRLVHPEMQEEYGLLTLNTSCSASLLTNDWVITAAHCLKPADLSNPSQVTLTANWETIQSRQGAAIRSFGPTPDIAIIRVASPFNVHGSTTGYRRRLAWEEDYYRLTTFGRGIYALAQGSGTAATPSQRDGEYRFAPAQIKKLEQNLYRYAPNELNQITAGGDSGGPSFTQMITGPVLVGVHSTCKWVCLPGKMCGRQSPSPWDWVSNIPECADAPVYAINAQISQIIGANAPPPPDTDTTPAPDTNYGPLWGSTPASAIPSYIYGIRSDGGLKLYRHNAAATGLGLESLGAWEAHRDVGRGWSNFKQVFPGGGNVIYAITNDGILQWRKHNGAWEGRGLESPGAWEGHRDVDSGWGNFKHIFSGGEGIIYAITESGVLQWRKHLGYKEGLGLESPGSWVGHRNVGTGWQTFKQVFSPGDGIVYAIAADGTLKWYKHKFFKDARRITLGKNAKTWEGPNDVGRGWGNLLEAFALLPGTPDVIR